MPPRHLLPILLLPLLLLAPLGLASPAAGGDEPTTDWRTLAKDAGLTGPEVERLARDKVLVGPQSCKQVFSAYLGCELPVFVTSDSILNAFHVVFEASLVELERSRARSMAEHLRFLLRRLRGVPEAAGLELAPELLDPALRRATTTVGVALALLDAPLDELPDDVQATVREEAARVREAQGTSRPAWLGPPDEGFTALDYTRFQPRGFYTRTPDLERYFRAVAWLQAIPFRVRVDEELLAALLLACAIEHDAVGSTADQRAGWSLREFLRGNTDLWGPGDDPMLTTGGSWTTPFDARAFRARQQQLAERLEASRIGDQVAYGPLGPAMRILPAARLPDAVLLERTTKEVDGRPLPSGLDVAAALGAAPARAQLAATGGEAVLRQVDRSAALFVDAPGLEPTYLRALGVLAGPPEPDAPALFASRPWQLKNTQTVLSAWAQMRHAYVLHAKQSAYYLGLTEQEPGFVEPVPSFYRALRDVVIEAERLLEAGGAFDTGGLLAGLASELRAAANRLDVLDPATVKEDPWFLFEEEEAQRIVRAMEILYRTGAFEWPDHWDGPTLQRMITALRATAARFEEAEAATDDSLKPVLESHTLDLPGTWESLQHLLIDLELLAHKQLRGVPFDGEDRAFFEHYGERLAGVMFYGGNLWLTPRDDAPRVVDVASDPGNGRVLLVGIGRPRALYVLYPKGGEEILCRGAVLPYHEVVDRERLMDEAWRERLDASQPAPPDWVRPILSEQPVRPPEED